MLRLTFDLHVGPGRSSLPDHLGGVLHGFVDRSVMNHAPHLGLVLRPNGRNELTHYMIRPPPYGQLQGDIVRFDLTLFGAAVDAWPELLLALIEQQTNGLHGRRAHIDRAGCVTPNGEAFALLDHGRILKGACHMPVTRNAQTMLDTMPVGNEHTAFHSLSFPSPLLLASHKAQRDPMRVANGLRPSLGAILDSIKERMCNLEPELADALNLAPKWKAPPDARRIGPITSAATPAKPIKWKMKEKHNSKCDNEGAMANTPSEDVIVPGIVGELIYPTTGIEHERSLLYWGQWLGVGQRTAMGFGSYALTYR